MVSLDRNSLLYWFPKIQDLGIPFPRTEHVLLTDEEKKEYYSGEGDFFNLKRVSKEIKVLIESSFSLPVFMRTDEYSGKHFWKKTCYLDNLDNLNKNLAEIVLGSRFADFLGGLPIEAMVVREFIPMDSKFTAFIGDMPVSAERRYFVEGGEVICHHPYWIEKAVEQGAGDGRLPLDWKELSKKMNFESEGEIELLRGYAERVSKSVEGYWSVDFCKARSGEWFIIDMALGNQSWHDENCRYSNMPKEKHVNDKDFDDFIKSKD